jgi:hypothetical protein
MSEVPAKFRLSVRDGVLEVEGSEEFVAKIIADYSSLVRVPAQTHSSKEAGQPKKSVQVPAAGMSTPDGEVGLAEFDRVFAMHDDTLKLICDLPGGSNAEKTQKATLLWLLGEKLRGTDGVALEAIRGVCRDHGCFDSANFSSHIKKLKSQVTLVGGRGGSAKLTKPGEKEALALAREIQGE